MLVRERLISEEQMLRVISRMTDNLVDNEQIRFGEVLVELGFLSGQQVFEALERQARQKLLRCFQFEQVAYDFEETDYFVDEIQFFKSSVPALLLEGIARHYTWERLKVLLDPYLQHRIVCRGNLREGMQAFGLNIDQSREMEYLMKQPQVGALLETGVYERELRAALVVAFYLGGLIELRSPQQREAKRYRVERLKPVVGKAVGSGPPSQRKIALSAVKDQRRLSPWARRSVVARLRGIAGPDSVEEVGIKDERMRRMKAESAFHKGRRLRVQGALPLALKQFKSALELDPSTVEYALHHAYVELLMCSDPMARPELAKKTRSLALATLNQDQQLASAHNILGNLCKLSGDMDAAIRHFTSAHRLDPEDHEADREIRLYNKRKAKGGIFGKS